MINTGTIWTYIVKKYSSSPTLFIFLAYVTEDVMLSKNFCFSNLLVPTFMYRFTEHGLGPNISCVKELLLASSFGQRNRRPIDVCTFILLPIHNVFIANVCFRVNIRFLQQKLVEQSACPTLSTTLSQQNLIWLFTNHLMLPHAIYQMKVSLCAEGVGAAESHKSRKILTSMYNPCFMIISVSATFLLFEAAC